MTAVDSREELVPLRTDFDVVWRGFDPGQVMRFVQAVEADLGVLAVDRDAAVARADGLARALESARAEVRELHDRLDRLCRTPVDPATLDERSRRRVELAEAEATEITTRAEAAADRTWAAADEAATRLRLRYEELVAGLDARRGEAEVEHRALMRRAREHVEATVREAARRRRELDEQAAAERERVRTDFELAMAGRRADAARALARQEAEARARADALLREAAERSEAMITAARKRVDELRGHRDRVAAGLAEAWALLDRAESDLAPLPGEIPLPR
ncbi:hypothetical protein [Umezawaea sp.]|uniref:hypothetical protein n=1 Tax=Umezawaea sp. TaxID=1955258 RepID=UPI002ED5ABF3